MVARAGESGTGIRAFPGSRLEVSIVWHIDHVKGTAVRESISTQDDWLTVVAKEQLGRLLGLHYPDQRGQSRSFFAIADFTLRIVAKADEEVCQEGIFRPRGQNKKTLGYATDDAYYELDSDLRLKRVRMRRHVIS